MVLRKINQAAELLNVSVSTAYALVESGALPSISVGIKKGLRVSDEDLDAFIASRRRQKGREPRSPSKGKLNPFKHLDGERIRAAWRDQGVE